jgi:hypothetical protein
MVEDIVNHYIIIINDYFEHMTQSTVLNNLNNNTYIFSIGLNTVLHVYKIALLNTKNFENTQFLCQKAYYCYLEYIEQMNKSNLLHNLNNSDAIIFVYKKALNDINQPNTNYGFTNINNIQSSKKNTSITGNINDTNERLEYILNTISVITKTLLFYKNSLLHENIEQSGEIYKEPHEKNNNITIYDMKLIKTNFLHKYIQFIYPPETPIYNYCTLFEYIQFIQQKLDMSTEKYCEFLKELYKYIKKIKKSKELPSLSNMRNITIELFYIDENINILHELINTDKMSQFVKLIFTIPRT